MALALTGCAVSKGRPPHRSLHLLMSRLATHTQPRTHFKAKTGPRKHRGETLWRMVGLTGERQGKRDSLTPKGLTKLRCLASPGLMCPPVLSVCPVCGPVFGSDPPSPVLCHCPVKCYSKRCANKYQPSHALHFTRFLSSLYLQPKAQSSISSQSLVDFS